MKTVLIVDDDKDIRDMLSVALSAESWFVQITDSLLGAISCLNAHNDIDCMLLDYNLPGMPMADFLTQARAVAPKTGIILISAVDKIAEKTGKIGLKHYLKKPFDLDDLRSVMGSCIAEQVK